MTAAATTTTPLRKQYLDVKRRHRDALLLFRIGDFYEAFDDDARLLARELDIVLTSKPMGRNQRVPLAGVPHQSLERHLATLLARGHRVAICEQLTETPVRGGEAGRRLIERDVVRVVTPGTVLEPGLLQSKVNNYLAAYFSDGRRAGIAYADVTTGEFAATELEAAAAVAELRRIAPAEVLVPRGFEFEGGAPVGFVTHGDPESFEHESGRRALLQHFATRTLVPFGLTQWRLATSAAGALVAYLRETQATAAGQLTRLASYRTDSFMRLDPNTFRSLEIFESMGGGAPSLLATLDETRTAMGGRLLRRWLRQPLLDVAEIVRRQDHVTWFVAETRARSECFAALDAVHDLERLSARARSGTASAQEVLAIGQSLEAAERVRAVLERDTKRFSAALAALPSCEGVADLIRTAINDQLPMRPDINTGVIREGFSADLDQLRALLRDGRSFLAELERRERARTGIKSLRVGYNKVFGYYIEVTRPNLHLVPDNYTRKQTLTQGERFITLELKEHESLVLNAQERIAELEASLFRRICVEVGKSRPEILTAAATIAYVDAIGAFAESAARYNYVRPIVEDSPKLDITRGRHPVLERIRDGSFVANDLQLGGVGTPEIALITGPNMSGKSTFLRQAALIVLMAQTGCFVPAEAAVVGLCDRIYTRIGLYDRIGSGESTFMTEMVETAQILHHATPRSLILLDELGRGTSTYDGLAVARAVLEYIHNHPRLRSKTLFATHYHELTEVAGLLPRLRNLHVEIAEQGGDLSFLYKVSPGVAEKSYGIYAAKLAGLPQPVVHRAQELLAEYEAPVSSQNEAAGGASSPGGARVQQQPASTAYAHETRLVEALLEADPDALSPVEALMKIYELRRLAEAEMEKSIRAVRSA